MALERNKRTAHGQNHDDYREYVCERAERGVRHCALKRVSVALVACFMIII